MSEHATRAARALRASLCDPNMADGAEKDLATIIDQRDAARDALRIIRGVLSRDQTDSVKQSLEETFYRDGSSEIGGGE